MLTRLLIVVVAVGCLLAGTTGLRTGHRCDDVKGGTDWRAVADRCGDPRDRAFAAARLAADHRRGDAIALARQMVRDVPQDYLGWLALGRLTGDERAVARAHALNPRGVPPPERPR